MQEGESPGSVPLAGVRDIRFADDVPEPGDGGSPVYLRKRTESRAGLGYGPPRSAPWDGLLRKETFKYGPGRLPSPSGQGRGHGTRWGRGDGVVCLCRGPAWGPLGWAEALSPRVGRVGFPGFLGSSLR